MKQHAGSINSRAVSHKCVVVFVIRGSDLDGHQTLDQRCAPALSCKLLFAGNGMQPLHMSDKIRLMGSSTLAGRTDECRRITALASQNVNACAESLTLSRVKKGIREVIRAEIMRW